MKISILTVIFWITVPTIFAQIPDLGLNPHRQKWQQIYTDTAQVIFPVGMEKSAQHLANLIHTQAKTTTSIGKRIHKIPIILHNQTTIPNGFVAIAPFRSEYYMTPPQLNFNGATAWQDILSIHEYRHVQQNANMKVGITKFASYLFGQYGWAILGATAVPRWYKEGDAVLTETLLTHAGRGRQPMFDMEYRAILLNSKKYNYEKAAAGSFRDFVPNFYRMGYYMTTYGRKKFGQTIWIKTMDNAARYDKLFYPFSRAFKNHTGLNMKELYQKTFQELDSIWRAEDNKLTLTASKSVTPELPKIYTEYRNPTYWTSDKVICEKSSFRHIREFVIVRHDGQEKRLFKAGQSSYYNRSLSVKKDKMVWAETRFHERWSNVQYSVIMLYDMKNLTKKQLTRKTRYFAPALSEDASKLVAVHVSENQTYNLHILNTKSGKIVHEIPNPTNEFYAFPTWTTQNQIVVTAQSSKGNRLILIDIETGNLTDLVSLTNLQISNPKVSGDYVFFSGAFTKINNIFAVKITTPNQLFQVSSVRFGAFQPAVFSDTKQLIFSEFNHFGYTLKQLKIEPETWKKFDISQAQEIDYFKPLLQQEISDLPSKLDTKKYNISKFSKSTKLINIHSLGYTAFHPNYGIELHAQNFFSTMYGTLGGTYNVNEKQLTYYADFNYGEWYSMLNFGVSHGNRFSYVLYPSVALPKAHIWSETSGYVGLKLPLNLSSGINSSRLDLSIKYNFLNLNYQDEIFDLTRGGMLNTSSFELIFNRIQLQALQNLYPKWGVNFYAQGQTTLLEKFNSGNRIYVEGGIYLPSIFQNHGFYLSGGYRKEAVIGAYRFQDNFVFSRGYLPYFSNEIRRLSINYGMPLVRPDWAIGGVLFLQQIKANTFFDYSKYYIFSDDNLQRSLGTEIRFDFRFLRLLNVDMGFRYSRLLDPNPVLNEPHQRFELLIFRLDG